MSELPSVRLPQQERKRRLAEDGFAVVESAYPFGDLVELQLKNRSNIVHNTINIDARLTIGSCVIQIPRQRLIKSNTIETFRISLRQCTVKYRCHDCEVDINSKYKLTLQKSSFEATFRSDEVLVSSRSVRASADASGEISASLRPRADTKIKLALSTDSAKSENRSEIEKITPQVALISHTPNGWIIGDELYGDPRHQHIGYRLQGTYFSDPNSETPNTFTAQLSGRTAGIDFYVGCHDSLIVEPINYDGASERAKISDRRAVIERMKQKLGGILVEKIAKRTLPDFIDNGLVLAAVKCAIQKHDEHSQTPPPEKESALCK